MYAFFQSFLKSKTIYYIIYMFDTQTRQPPAKSSLGQVVFGVGEQGRIARAGAGE